MNNNNTEPQAAHDPPRSAKLWRIARRVLLGVAVVATLLLVFHTVENWRGQRAWEQARRESEARGLQLDWNAYIPKPIPPEQNFFAAPKMREWFVRDSMASMLNPQTNTGKPFRSHGSLSKNVKPVHSPDRNPIRLAVFHLRAEGASDSSGSNIVLRLSDPEAPARFRQHLRERLSGLGASTVSGVFAAEWPDNRPALQVNLLADNKPTVEQMRQKFLPDYARISAGLRLDEDGTNGFKVHLGNSDVYLAADYLAWTDADAQDFEMIRKALERPFAQIEGDYSRPFESPIPNFIAIRTVAQMLADRAECHLLMKNPQGALDELTLLHRFSQRMNPAPRFLVSAMIHVAVTGLYTSIIQEGLRLNAWEQPQLLALEQQLKETRLITSIAESLRTERAASCRTFEMSTPSELARLMDGARGQGPLHVGRRSIEAILIPRGWMAQNSAVLARLGAETLESFDLENQTVNAEELNRLVGGIEAEFKGLHPYTMIAKIALPNISKAVQKCAQTQALVQAGRAACALERYRFKNSTYPDSLDKLMPVYTAEVPRDPIGGQPLKYRAIGSGFLLYSLGWNQQDDGGVILATSASGSGVPTSRAADNAQDWVW